MTRGSLRETLQVADRMERPSIWDGRTKALRLLFGSNTTARNVEDSHFTIDVSSVVALSGSRHGDSPSLWRSLLPISPARSQLALGCRLKGVLTTLKISRYKIPIGLSGHEGSVMRRVS